MTEKEITREYIQAIVDDARAKKVKREDHVRDKLKSDVPGIETATIKRNGNIYNLLDYIAEDLDSYGTSS